MYRIIEYSEIDKSLDRDGYLIIDVRSPGEFENATIPGAVNMPIFDDEERKVIGTVYTQESVEKAKKLGMEAAAKKLPRIYEKLSKLDKEHEKLVLFCARGGLRSSSLVSLFTSLGLDVYKLSGGYKGYRAYISENLPKSVEGVKFVVIHGNTGVGKTNILKGLKEIGYSVLDLEECANHRGSLLGSVGLGEQNSQKKFESLIYDTLKNRKSDKVFVEGESKKIGNIIIPEYLFNAMKVGVKVKLEADIDLRVKNILSEYVNKNNEEIIYALNLLRKHISGKSIDRYIEMINKNDYENVIKELMIKYYDPLYESKEHDFALVLNFTGVDETCESLLKGLKDKI
jgi:tRNA 2-selenouridine synthase